MRELDKQVSVRKIKEAFNLTQVCGDDHSLDRWTIVQDVNRPGLELSGYKEDSELKRVVVIGKKEHHYIETLDYDTQRDRFEFLTDIYTPCIIITQGNKAPQALIDVAGNKNFPVFEYPDVTYQFVSDLTAFLTAELAPNEYVGGGLMNIYGVGVAILGESGIGKSELELDLIKRGHIFVADDVIDVHRINNELVGQAPENLKRMMEIRGVGIVDVCLMFGGHCYSPSCPITFAIKLTNYANYLKSSPNRLDPLENTTEILGIEIPLMEIPVTEGKLISTIVESAVSRYIIKQRGIDTNEEFQQRIYKEIKNKK